MDPASANNGRPVARAAATVAVLLGLTLLATFTWRVVFYMNAISTGTLDVASLSYTDQFTTANAIAAAPATGVDMSSKDAPFTGPEKAALTIVQFADFECPFSRQVSASIRSLALRYQDTVRVEFRHLPLDEIHPDARRAAEASECAREQGKFWEYHDKLFANQADISADNLGRFAAEIGLDRGTFDRCMVSGRMAERIRADETAAVAAGIVGTPTFFFNGTPVQGAIPSNILDLVVKRYVP